jgi:hypothetical protein
MSHEDELAKLRAAIDQANEGMKELAAPCWTFYQALQEEGFNPDQAMTVMLSWLTTSLAKAGGSDV